MKARIGIMMVAGLALAATATAVTWNDADAGDSNWTTDGNWDGGVQPTSAESGVIGYTDDTIANVNNSGAVCYKLHVGFNSTGNVLNVNSGDLTVGPSYVGYNADDTGTINISGGVLARSVRSGIGYSGTGIVNQTGGTNAYDYLVIGYEADSVGTYNMGGGYMSNAVNTAIIGRGGQGTLIQTNGIVDLAGGYALPTYVGYYSNSVGTIDISGDGYMYIQGQARIGFYAGATGIVTVAESATFRANENQFQLGYSGRGTLNINGGNASIIALRMGESSSMTGSGTMNLTGGTLTNEFYTYVGLRGRGEVVQTGGDYVVGGRVAAQHGLRIGHWYTSEGTYTISGGSLSVSSDASTKGLMVGGDGTGVGTTGGTGTLKIIGNAATITANAYNQAAAGTLIVEVDGTGISTIDAADAANLSGTLEVFDSGSAFGAYDIITAASGITGTFDTVIVPDSTWGVIYGTNTVSVFHGVPKIISLTSTGSGSEVEMVFDSPAPSLAYPLKRANLIYDSWDIVPHSDVSGGTYVETNLSYSTPVSGTTNKVYLQTIEDTAFFGIGE